MEEEAGKLPSDENDVRPVLSAIESVKEETQGKKNIVIVDRKRDTDEDIFSEEFTRGLFKPGNLAVGGPAEEETAPPEEGEAAVPEEGESTPTEGGETEENEEIPPAEETQKSEEPEPVQVSQVATNKKTKIMVDPNASAFDIATNVHYLTALPVVPESDIPFTPILYTFRVKAKGRTCTVKKVRTKPPPFYVQVDHAIAVIWMLFNKEANQENLGIVHLQWALHFLESIYNDEGVHPKDVHLCITAIQDCLIDKYAAMSEEPAIYGSSTFGDFVNKEEDEKGCFSVNYSQMAGKCPPPCGVEAKESEVLDKQLLDELENVKKVVGIESIDLAKVVSKDQVMNILNDWKKEQIEKIQDELKMLYVVEDMMKNSDSQNFEGYTDESQFDTIFKKNK